MALTMNVTNNVSKYMTITSNQINKSSQRLSSGNRINSAADDAAGLAISKKMEALIRGLDQGTNNSYDMQNLLYTAEGDLNTISDSLLRIRDMAVQAKNDTYTADDRALMQNEVTALLDHIDYTVGRSQFNNKNLLDGTFTNQHVASDAHGNGMDISIDALSTVLMGIDGFDLTGNFSIDDIDHALSMVNTARSQLGAQINRLSYTIEGNQTMMINQAQAKSRIADADMAKETMNLNKAKVMEQYQFFALKQKMSGMGSFLNLLV